MAHAGGRLLGSDLGRTAEILCRGAAGALCAFDSSLTTTPLRARIRGRTSLGAPTWYWPDVAVHGGPGAVPRRWDRARGESRGADRRCVPVVGNSAHLSTVAESLGNVNRHHPHSHRAELIGWSAFLLFVAAVFGIRRALDRR